MSWYASMESMSIILSPCDFLQSDEEMILKVYFSV